MLVIAKRLGWDQPDGEVSQHDDYDPPAWMDDGLDPAVSGELTVHTFPANEMYRERKAYRVCGELVDPKTIERNNVPLSIDQPREPSGTSKGGQFAKKGGVGVHTVKVGNLKSKFSVHTDKRISNGIKLKNYRQQDSHSCGFVAALTVARYLKPDTSARDVLSAVRPTKGAGIDRAGLTGALKQIGIAAVYRDDLDAANLRRLVDRGIPVVVTVWPDDYRSDHWVVVQGFDGNRVYLTNYKSVSVRDFNRIWFDRGEGLVCQPAVKKKGGG